MKKISSKINYQEKIFFLYTIIATLIIIAFGFLSIFLYKNFYVVITGTEEIDTELKPKIETINTKKFNSIIEKFEQKNTLPEINITNDPF